MGSQVEYPELLRVGLRDWKDQTSVQYSVGMRISSLASAFFFAYRSQVFLLPFFFPFLSSVSSTIFCLFISFPEPSEPCTTLRIIFVVVPLDTSCSKGMKPSES